MTGRDGGATHIARFRPTDDDEALDLERRCPQGRKLRLSFRRESFQLRSRSFSEWAIWTARDRGRLVGITASAIKPAELFGRRIRAGFAYDLRVDPDYRGQGIARRLMSVAHEWAFERAELGYTYTVADNRAAEHLISDFGADRSGSYEYLIAPACRELPFGDASTISPEAAHQRHLDREGPFDFYTPPDWDRMRTGHVRSWLVGKGPDSASCSAWDNSAILGETIEAVPLSVQTARLASRLPLLRLRSWPHFPRAGEAIRSWYLFDVTAASSAAAWTLARAVAREAMECGVNWLYWIAPDDVSWKEAVLADAPRLASLRVRYLRMLQHRDSPAQVIGKSYVDVRDV